MKPGPWRWMARDLGAVLLALLLALAVWISAVVTADPNERHVTRAVGIEVVGLDPELLLVSDLPTQARLTLWAPKSIWDKLNNNPGLTRTWVDLSGLGAGTHTVGIQAQVEASPVRYVGVEPQTVNLTLEPLVKRSLPVTLSVIGEVPLGYRKGAPAVLPQEVSISGPESQVALVDQVKAELNIAGATSPIERSVNVNILDENGDPVQGLTLAPKEVVVSQPVELLGGFKNAAVKVVTTGQVANGYRMTNISVAPPSVTLFANDPNLIERIPGFVETLPVDLTGLTDDQEVLVGLNLPEGVSLVREPNVLVQVSVADIEGSVTLPAPLQVIGLAPEVSAVISPETVDLIVVGPLNALESLTPLSFRVVIDLTGLPPGVYQRPVIVDRSPGRVRVQTALPDSVEVTIELLPTLTPTALPSGTVQPSPTPTILSPGTVQPSPMPTILPTGTVQSSPAPTILPSGTAQPSPTLVQTATP